MHETPNSPPLEESQQIAMSPWRLTGWLCGGVIAASVVACVIMAAVRSTGLMKITVTALDKAAEPRDHDLPLIKQKEALPDYQIIVNLNDGQRIQLGAKPDTSAVDGLTWNLSDPVSLAEVASVRLQEQDKLLSDTITEVQITSDSVTQAGYRFDFHSERSVSVGVRSFFKTPVGMAIATGFCIAVLLMLLRIFLV